MPPPICEFLRYISGCTREHDCTVFARTVGFAGQLPQLPLPQLPPSFYRRPVPCVSSTKHQQNWPTVGLIINGPTQLLELTMDSLVRNVLLRFVKHMLGHTKSSAENKFARLVDVTVTVRVSPLPQMYASNKRVSRVPRCSLNK